jgi:hypothetical protein
LIAVVVMIIVVVVIVKEGWLNEVIDHGYVAVCSSLQILRSGG